MYAMFFLFMAISIYVSISDAVIILAVLFMVAGLAIHGVLIATDGKIKR
jgi:hypothetical protein